MYAVTECARLTVDRKDLRFDEYDAAIEAGDWRTTLIGPVKGLWHMESLSVDGIRVQKFQDGAATTTVGVGRAGQVTLAIGLPGPAFAYINGVRLNCGRMTIIRPGECVAAYGGYHCRHVMLSLPVERFIDLIGCNNSSQTERLMSGPVGLKISHQHWQNMSDALTGVLRNAETDKSRHYRISQQAAIEELLTTFIGSAIRTLSAAGNTGRPQLARRLIIERTIEILNSPSYFDYSIAQMAQYVGISERTLRSVCRKYFGVCPKQLILFRQLQDIRTSLQQASPHEKVSRLTARYGVWDWGRFAVRYRKLFGEKPSETLACRPASSSIESEAYKQKICISAGYA